MPNLVALGSNMFNGYPHFVDLSVSNKFGVGGGSNAPATFTRNTYQLSDDVDLIRGKHHILFGAEAMQMLEAYQDHLARFPTCPFATLAKLRIDALSKR